MSVLRSVQKLKVAVAAAVIAVASGTYAARADSPRAYERELADLYQQKLSESLSQIFPDHRFGVFVDVAITDPSALAQLPQQPEFLPGTSMPSMEIWKSQYRGALEALPQKRKILVVIPPESETSLVAAVKSASVRTLRIEALNDELSVEKAFGKPEIKETPKPHEERAPASEKPKRDDSDEGFNWWFWLAGAGLLLLVVGFLAYAMLSRLRGAPKSAMQKMMNVFKRNKAKGKDRKEKKEAKPAAAEGAAEATGMWPPANFTFEAAVDQVEKMATAYPDLASQALISLASRPDLAQPLAVGVQVMGPSRAITLFPYVSQGAWTQIGESVAARPVTPSQPASLEELLYFVQMLSSEVYRIQGERKTPKLMPELEKKSPQELIQQVGARDAKSMAMLLAVLPPHLGSALLSVVPQSEQPELFRRLAGINQISSNEVESLEHGLMGTGGQEKMYPVDTAPKMVEILSALGPAEELQMFSKMVVRDPAILGKVAPSRLYPEHLPYIPPESLTPFVQDLDIDQITAMAFAVDTAVVNLLLPLLSEKQRSIVRDSLQDGQGGGEGGHLVLRNFLDQVHRQLFRNNPANVQKMFGRGGGGGAARAA